MERHGYTLAQICVARRFNAGLPRCDARDRWQGARAVPSKACRWWAWSTGAWRSISISSTAAACACSTRSRSRTITCWRARPAISKVERVALLLGVAGARGLLAGGVTMRDSRSIVRLLRARGAHAAPRTSTTRSCCSPKPQRKAMCAIYAFMRYCDDLSDDPGANRARHRTAGAPSWKRRSKAASAATRSGRPSITPCAASASRTSTSAK